MGSPGRHRSQGSLNYNYCLPMKYKHSFTVMFGGIPSFVFYMCFSGLYAYTLTRSAIAAQLTDLKINQILPEMQQKTDVLSSDFKEKLFQQRASKLEAPYTPSLCVRHPWAFCVLLYNCGCGSTPSWLNLCLDFRNHRQQFLCL